jgi:predicted hydrocarbon binding protein
MFSILILSSYNEKYKNKKKKLSKGRTAGHIFGREPSNDYFIKIFFLLSKWFQIRRFLWKFPIGSYVKLSSAVAAIEIDVEIAKCAPCRDLPTLQF